MRPHKKILLVDGDPVSRSERCFQLWVWDYAVLEADGSEAALAVLARTQHLIAHQPNTLDLMLVQAELPGREELYAAARALQPTLPVLWLYAATKPRDLHEDIELWVQRRRGPLAAKAEECEAMRLRA